jgi:hypothetical protein
MAIIKIILQDEHGKIIEEIKSNLHLLSRFLPYNDESSQCLRFIDPYGDMVFNCLQMNQFITEWEQVAKKKLKPKRKRV